MRSSGKTIGRISFAVVLASAASSTALAQTTHEVDLLGFSFVPQDLTISVGDTVHWQWAGAFHNVISGVEIKSANPTRPKFETISSQSLCALQTRLASTVSYRCLRTDRIPSLS